MQKKLRHQLIEILVIIALLLIFVPAFYSYHPRKTEVAFEPPPAFPSFTLNNKTSPPTDSNTGDALQKLQAFVIDLGQFSKPEDARRLLLELQQKNFKAFLYPDADDPSLVELLVGPEIGEDAVQELLTRLQQETTLKGNIVAFRPLRR